MDFFQVDKTYLAIADRYSNWLSIVQLQRDDSATLTAALREFFCIFGVPENITTDNATVFTSAATQDFLNRWGVEHRTSSPYYPRANKRAELAVKHAKRLVMNNLGPKGSLNTDKLCRALLVHRNNPDPRTGLSPAQIIFGKTLRDHLPAPLSRHQPRPEWRLKAQQREAALTKGLSRMDEHYRTAAKDLPPLPVGTIVAIQDPHQDKAPARWSKTGTIVEALPHQTYTVRVDGVRKVTQRHRRFLRKITPFLPEHSPEVINLPAPRVITRSMTTPQHNTAEQGPSPAMFTAPPATSAAPATPMAALLPPPATSSMATRCMPLNPAAHREKPAGPPGVPIVDLLRAREHQGILS